MPVRAIVRGQKVASEKVQRSRELRKSPTHAEGILWQALRGNQLDGRHFRRQQIISGYVVDFYCHQTGLVIEVDGGIHARQVAYDSMRDQAFEALGLRVLHVRNQDVIHSLPSVLMKIRAASGPPVLDGPVPSPEGEG